jgi:pimeloyl-[acyl-carrier protein] methyl ester esterase
MVSNYFNPQAKGNFMKLFKETTGQGKDVVILHGWGCDHRYMQPIVDQLKDRYRVSNFDLPGRGKSDWQPNIETIHDIADSLLPELPKNAIYIGWSFGGLVSISIAARYPELVERFIGVATTPKFVEDNEWPGVPKPGFISGFGEIKDSGYKNFMHAYYESEFANFDVKPEAYPKLLALLAEEPQCDINILLKGINICDATDLRNEFHTISKKIDFIMSSQDGAVLNAAHNKIKAINSNARMHVIPDAHHMSFWTHQKEFKENLEKILQS